MEDKNRERLAESGRRVREKIESASSAKTAQGGDFDEIRGTDTIRRNDGSVRYSSSVDSESKPRRRVTKMSRKRYRRQNGAFIVLILFFCAVIALSVWLIVRNRQGGAPVAPETDYIETTSSLTDSDEATDTHSAGDDTASPTELATVTVDKSEVRRGNLILVNYKYDYVFPEEDILFPMKERAEHFSVSALDVSLQSEALDAFVSLTNDQYRENGFESILVVSSFRGIEKQKEIYQDRLDRYGSEYAAAYVANPGYSEHHTGLAMDLTVYTGGASYDIETYDGCAWFNENYDKYGYILRYPEHKAGITSINYEGWHYRYVGLPHSLIMDRLDLCLEEYTDYTREHGIDSAVCYNAATGEITTVDATTYEKSADESIVYFVPSSDGDATDVPVAGNDYSISGNNVDGFVVTVY